MRLLITSCAAAGLVLGAAIVTTTLDPAATAAPVSTVLAAGIPDLASSQQSDDTDNSVWG